MKGPSHRCRYGLLISMVASCSSSGGPPPDASVLAPLDAAAPALDAGLDAPRLLDVAADAAAPEVAADAPTDARDGVADTGADTGGPSALPGMGQRCRDIQRQGDPACAPGLVCIEYGPQQGEGRMCTRECSGPGDAVCSPGAACGRRWQVGQCAGGIDGCPVCEIPCDPAGPPCATGTRCVKDPLGTAVSYCVPV